MKVSVDRSQCISNGLCVAIAPRLFDLDNEGKLVVLVPENTDLPAEFAEEQRRLTDAAASCPVGAIKVVDG